METINRKDFAKARIWNKEVECS